MRIRIPHILSLSCAFIANITHTCISKLDLHDTGEITEVTLPHKYINQTKIDLKNTIVLLECFAHAWNNKESNVAIGFVSPCVAIVLHNKENGKTFAAHSRYCNSSQSLKEQLKKLEVTDPSAITGYLFSVTNTTYDQQTNGFFPFKELHNGKSQDEQIAHIKTTIVKTLHITDHDQIETYRYTSTLSYKDLGNYPHAEMSIWTDGSLNKNGRLKIRSICLMHENIIISQQIKDESLHKSAGQFAKTITGITSLLLHLYMEQAMIDQTINQYEKVPYQLINEMYIKTFHILKERSAQELAYILYEKDTL